MCGFCCVQGGFRTWNVFGSWLLSFGLEVTASLNVAGECRLLLRIGISGLHP